MLAFLDLSSLSFPEYLLLFVTLFPVIILPLLLVIYLIKLIFKK